ncbi:glycosyltransferase [Novosphingobium sp. SL115]|uniref:glycosyltransferase family 2 protein n=1 Tax=Novosphingobium sp. SL115 TaxID=2995150 RepID=UPI0022750E05|nr:glycosyltransferase [Novosphingobium sp. SL115]MCY1669471.1 glycosyltransferase [Novosphingobium sp. SL115]
MSRSDTRAPETGNAKGRNVSQTVKVFVGVPTCRNPVGLRKTLDSIFALETEHSVQVAVIDNDAGQQGRSVVESYPAPISYVPEARAGIPFARNAIIATFLESSCDHLLMIDDDEMASRSWIDALVVALQQGADVVAGPVVPVILGTLPPGLLEEDYTKSQLPVLEGVERVDSTANIGMSRAFLLRCEGHFFNESYAMSGGSDSEFLRRTARLGTLHAFAAKGLVYEDIGPSRLSQDWLLKRHFRNGTVYGRVTAEQKGRIKAMLSLGFRSLALIFRSNIRRLQSRGNPRIEFLSMRDRARGSGIWSGLNNRIYDEYDPKNYR